MKRVLIRLESYLRNGATDVEKSVLRYILKNPREAASMDIHTLAAKGYCSASTLVRICKKNGFSGYRQMRQALIEELGFRSSVPKNNFDAGLSDQGVVEHILYEDIKGIQNTFSLLDLDTLEKVVALMSESASICLFGIGASFLVMRDFAMKCVRINKQVTIFEDVHMQMIVASNILPGQLCVIASYSGQTQEMLKIAESIRERQGTLVVITQYSQNDLASMADYVLYVPRIEQELRVGASSSRISQLAIIDAIFHVYMSQHYDTDMAKIESTQQMLKKQEHEDAEDSSSPRALLYNDL